jgi:hypothetical protein
MHTCNNLRKTGRIFMKFCTYVVPEVPNLKSYFVTSFSGDDANAHDSQRKRDDVIGLMTLSV